MENVNGDLIIKYRCQSIKIDWRREKKENKVHTKSNFISHKNQDFIKFEFVYTLCLSFSLHHFCFHIFTLYIYRFDINYKNNISLIKSINMSVNMRKTVSLPNTLYILIFLSFIQLFPVQTKSVITWLLVFIVTY